MISSRRRRTGWERSWRECVVDARALESRTSRRRTLEGGVCLVYFDFAGRRRRSETANRLDDDD